MNGPRRAGPWAGACSCSLCSAQRSQETSSRGGRGGERPQGLRTQRSSHTGGVESGSEGSLSCVSLGAAVIRIRTLPIPLRGSDVEP